MAARGEAEPPGFSREKISLRDRAVAGGRADAPMLDLREPRARSGMPQMLNVPAAVKRTVGILPNRSWDKTSYVLGRTAGPGRAHRRGARGIQSREPGADRGKQRPRPARAAPFSRNLARRSAFDAAPFDARDAGHQHRFSRSRASSATFTSGDAARGDPGPGSGGGGAGQLCLVTGVVSARSRRCIPAIKGVWGAQSRGRRLFLSTSTPSPPTARSRVPTPRPPKPPPFRYGAALNRMLDRGSRNRLPPDRRRTVVFWADTSDTVDEAAARPPKTGLRRDA